jgi:isopentenyldiphosphate isomerase
MAQNYTPFEVVTTAFIVKEGKYLITRRSPSKKRFPGMWTVPGGHLEPADFLEEAKQYSLIDGIWDELAMADTHRSGSKKEWQRA